MDTDAHFFSSSSFLFFGIFLNHRILDCLFDRVDSFRPMELNNDKEKGEDDSTNAQSPATPQNSSKAGTSDEVNISGQEEAKEKEGEEGDEVEATMEEMIGTLDDIFMAEEEQEKVAELLLGGCLDMVCTYPEGYKFRQPLYSCKTCFEKSGKLAGVCYACSENCHDGHDMVELYTKRKFCCDCGNSKFDSKCKLFEEKYPVNERNQYNDNFKGIFCVCKKPYPPDENDMEATAEEMIQCCVCEDWLHPSHAFSSPDKDVSMNFADGKIPDEIEGIICKDCIEKHQFLAYYPFEKEEKGEEARISAEAQRDVKNTECKLEEHKAKQQGGEVPKIQSQWVWSGWRDQLCKCRKCMNMYDDFDCSFLIDTEDTIMHYEQNSREKAAQMEKERSIAKPDPDSEIKKLVMATAIEEMKQHCTEFFKNRSAVKRSITSDDVAECFEELRAKRQKRMEQLMKDTTDNGAWTQ